MGVGWVKHLQEIVEDINSYFHRLLNHPKVKEEVAAVSVSVAAMAAAIASRSSNHFAKGDFPFASRYSENSMLFIIS